MAVDDLYCELLTDADLRLVRQVTGARQPLEEALASPVLERRVFGPGLELGVSPPLGFAVAVNRAARMLEEASWVAERSPLGGGTTRSRVPVFDVASLRSLVGDPWRRFSLVQLLSSYTKVASGVTWVRSARGWQRRRFSELDPGRLAELVEALTPLERPGAYRRLGDLTLFLSGVFPDAPHRYPLRTKATLAKVSGLGPEALELEGLKLLEVVGSEAYRRAREAAELVGLPVTASLRTAADLGGRFDQARRFLNLVTDRYLFPMRAGWFGR